MKKFPCPYCKGSGIGEYGDSVSVGIGMMQISPDIECGYCEGEGMMEIGGEVHIKRHLEDTVLDLLHLLCPTDDWMISVPAQEEFVKELKTLTKKYVLKLEFPTELIDK